MLASHILCRGWDCPERESCMRFTELASSALKMPWMSTTADVIAKIPCRERIPAQSPKAA